MSEDALVSMESRLVDDPSDDAWGVYADLLEERGDPLAAVVRRGVGSGNAWGEAPGLLGELGRSRTVWVTGRSDEFRSSRLMRQCTVPYRGLLVELSLPDLDAQRRAAELLRTRGAELSRAALLYLEIDLHIGERLERELVEVLSALPFQQPAFRTGLAKGDPYRLDELPAARLLDVEEIPLSASLPKGRTLPLEALRVGHYQGSKIAKVLPRLPALERLALTLSGRADLKHIGSCAGLKVLELSIGNGVKKLDLTPLAALPLRHLTLFHGAHPDLLRPLADLSTLESLTLSWMEAPIDLSPIATLPALARVAIEECRVALDLAPLATLPSLKSLKVHESGQVEGTYEVQQAHPDLDFDWYEEIRE